jgi:hypothetical protein
MRNKIDIFGLIESGYLVDTEIGFKIGSKTIDLE